VVWDHSRESRSVGREVPEINRRKPILHACDMETCAKTRLGRSASVVGVSPARRAAHFQDRNIKPKIYNVGMLAAVLVSLGQMYDFRPRYDRP